MGRGEERVKCMERVTWKQVTTCKIANGNLLYGSGPQIAALYQPSKVEWGRRWEGGSRGRGMYVYLWLKFYIKKQNSVKQLFFNKKQTSKKPLF